MSKPTFPTSEMVAEIFEQPGEQSVELVAEAAPAAVKDLVRERVGFEAYRFTEVDAEVLERHAQQVRGMQLPQPGQIGSFPGLSAESAQAGVDEGIAHAPRLSGSPGRVEDHVPHQKNDSVTLRKQLE